MLIKCHEGCYMNENSIIDIEFQYLQCMKTLYLIIIHWEQTTLHNYPFLVNSQQHAIYLSSTNKYWVLLPPSLNTRPLNNLVEMWKRLCINENDGVLAWNKSLSIPKWCELNVFWFITNIYYLKHNSIPKFWQRIKKYINTKYLSLWMNHLPPAW